MHCSEQSAAKEEIERFQIKGKILTTPILTELQDGKFSARIHPRVLQFIKARHEQNLAPGKQIGFKKRAFKGIAAIAA